MRRWWAITLAVILLIALSPLAQARVAVFDLAADGGAIRVSLLSDLDLKLKTLVEKDGERYFYNLDKHQEWYPLQMGSGSYRVHLLEHVADNRYKFIQTEEVAVISASAEAVFLSSVQNVPWEQTALTRAKAQELAADADSAADRLRAVYNYVVENITYDDNKTIGLASDYLPDPDETIGSGQGICYDYASLVAAMLRSMGLPSKLVMGNAAGIEAYHAWNEVYIDGQWLIIDATYDARVRAAGLPVEMIKKEKGYQTDKVY